jgi:hypothetical protein
MNSRRQEGPPNTATLLPPDGYVNLTKNKTWQVVVGKSPLQ